MRALAILVLTAGTVTAHADPTTHATGAMFELRYSPESDTTKLPLSNSALTIGYMDERFAFGISVGLARNTLDDSTNAITTTQSWLTIGPTVRGVFLRSTDGATALVGEGTATLTEVTESTTQMGTEQSPIPVPTPLRFELGVGVRRWIVPELAIGAALLGRYTYSTVGNQTETQTSVGGAIYLAIVL